MFHKFAIWIEFACLLKEIAAFRIHEEERVAIGRERHRQCLSVLDSLIVRDRTAYKSNGGMTRVMGSQKDISIISADMSGNDRCCYCLPCRVGIPNRKIVLLEYEVCSIIVYCNRRQQYRHK